MLARRHALDVVDEQPYELEDVPRANRSLEGSKAYEVTDRATLLKMMPEMLQLCNQAALNFELAQRAKRDVVIHPGKPLGLEFVADRLYTGRSH